MEATDIFPSSFLTVSLFLHLARVSVTAASMRRYLDPPEVAQAVNSSRMEHQYVPLPEGLLFLPAQSQEHGGDSRRQAGTLGELDRAVEGP